MTAATVRRRVLLTGATSGIGLATARLLAPIADTLLLQGPEPPGDVVGTIDAIRALGTGPEIHYLQADYADLGQLVALTDAVLDRTPSVDLVINNAAIAGPARRTLSADGNELTLQVNYLAPVALTELLSQRADRPPQRVVNVASATHHTATLDLSDLDLRRGYSPVTAYARAKLALVTYTCWLAAHHVRPGSEVVSLHPGVIATDLLHAMFSAGGAPPEHAARNIVDVAMRASDDGTYYDETNPAPPNPIAHDTTIQARLLVLTAARLNAAGITIQRGGHENGMPEGRA
jgi:NAD(P)-dependent dehydrogenase (short-subunit alcohol dehydrogenase family)